MTEPTKMDFQATLQRAQMNQQTGIKSKKLLICEQCNSPFPAKWGKCPDCEPNHELSYAQVNEKLRIPARYREAYAGGFDASQSSLITDMANSTIDSVFLSGGTGTGKTFLASAIMQEYCKVTGLICTWSTSGQMLQAIRATYGSNATQTEAEVTKEYAVCSLLLIDDLGAEKVTDWSISSLYEIISDRINWCKPTIVTSNLTLNDLSAWNPRIASRLASFVVMKLTGDDKRLAK